ncbi:MAG TPA: hypothetical protein DGG95_05110, partial [Cytophagales bacterium]|nr:hypothetical protein [Cytophagales bacterium]
HFNDAKIANPKNTSLRPDFMILNYPVITFSEPLVHRGSRNNLIGKSTGLNAGELPQLDENDIRYFSSELNVTVNTPPTFITAPMTDDAVPVGNTFAFTAALQQNKVPVETFIYNKGPHGYGMKNPLAKEQWIDACIQWLNRNFNQPPMDWPNLRRYAEENKKIGLPKPGENRIVFMGNSITEGWKNFDPAFFEGKHYVNRGIGGQTTPQMLLRFQQDVIELKPKVVVILAGINDIANNTGPITLEQILNNIISMTELAKLNGIKVVLSSVTPAFDFPWRPGMEPNIKVYQLNQMIKNYAMKAGAVYLDYYSAMVDDNHGLKRELGYDGVHPNLVGYKVMEPLAEKAIEEALKKK